MKSVKRVWLFFSLISISLVAAISFYTAQRNKSIVHISAAELMKNYSEDAYGANKRYSGSRIIVKGQVRYILRTELSDVGFINQFRSVIVLSVSHVPMTKMTKKDGKASLLNMIRGGNEVRCSFGREQTYSLRNLEMYDFVEIQGDRIVLRKMYPRQSESPLLLSIENCVLVNHIPYDEIPIPQER